MAQGEKDAPVQVIGTNRGHNARPAHAQAISAPQSERHATKRSGPVFAPVGIVGLVLIWPVRRVARTEQRNVASDY